LKGRERHQERIPSVRELLEAAKRAIRA